MTRNFCLFFLFIYPVFSLSLFQLLPLLHLHSSSLHARHLYCFYRTIRDSPHALMDLVHRHHFFEIIDFALRIFQSLDFLTEIFLEFCKNRESF